MEQGWPVAIRLLIKVCGALAVYFAGLGVLKVVDGSLPIATLCFSFPILIAGVSAVVPQGEPK